MKKSSRYLLVLLLCWSQSELFAQNQGKISLRFEGDKQQNLWYFGNNAAANAAFLPYKNDLRVCSTPSTPGCGNTCTVNDQLFIDVDPKSTIYWIDDARTYNYDTYFKIFKADIPDIAQNGLFISDPRSVWLFGFELFYTSGSHYYAMVNYNFINTKPLVENVSYYSTVSNDGHFLGFGHKWCSVGGSFNAYYKYDFQLPEVDVIGEGETERNDNQCSNKDIQIKLKTAGFPIQLDQLSDYTMELWESDSGFPGTYFWIKEAPLSDKEITINSASHYSNIPTEGQPKYYLITYRDNFGNRSEFNRLFNFRVYPGAPKLNNGTATPLTAGTYTLDNGATITVTDASCYQTPDGKISVSLPSSEYRLYLFTGNPLKRGTNGKLEFDTSFGVVYADSTCTSTIINQLGVGSYNLIIERLASNNCSDGKCFTTIPITISQPLPFTFSVDPCSNCAPTNNIKCKGGTGQFKINVTNGTGSLILCDGSGNPISSGYTYSNGVFTLSRPAGTHTFKVKDSNCWAKNGIYDFVTIDLAEPTSQLAVSTPALSNPTCFAGYDGSISFNVSGGWSNYTYTLTGTDANNNNSISPRTGSGNTNTITGLPAGTYSLVVYDLNGTGCSVPFTNLKLDNPPVLAILSQSSTPPTCNGGTDGTITILPTGGYFDSEKAGNPQYSYSIILNGSTLSTSTVDYDQPVTFSGLKEVEYTIKVTAKSGCSKDFKITVPTKPKIWIDRGDVSVSHILCKGDSAGTIKVNKIQGGNPPYKVKLIKDDNILSPYDSIINVAENTTFSFTGLKIGKYQIQVVDSEGCPLPLNSSLTFPSDSAKFTNAVVNSTITSPTLESSYSYIQVLEPKTALAFDAIDYNTGVKIDSVTCAGASDGSISLKAVAKSGWGGYQYKMGTGSYQTSQVFSGLQAGTYTYYIKDALGCEIQKDFTIPEPLPLQILSDYVITNVDCFGNATGKINYTIVGGNLRSSTNVDKPYFDITFNGQPISNYTNTYNWDEATGVLKIETYKFLKGDYTLIVKDRKGCQTSLTFTITEPPLLQISVPANEIVGSRCGIANGSANVYPTGGTLPYKYLWTYTDPKTQKTTTASTDAGLTGAAGGIIYTITMTDNNNCVMVNNNVYIDNIDGVQTTYTSRTTLSCYNSTDGQATMKILNPTGKLPVSISWANQVVNDTRSITWLTDTTFVLKGLSKGNNAFITSDATGCTRIDGVEILGPDDITVSVLKQVTIKCHDGSDGSIQVSVSGGTAPYTYSWNVPNSSGLLSLSNLKAGDYTLTVQDANGCIKTETYTFANPPKLTLPFQDVVTLCTGQTLNLDAGFPGAEYQWTSKSGKFTANSRRVAIKDADIYYVKVTTAQGCIIQDDFELKTTNTLLKANFLMDPAVLKGDTVVAIEVSWPEPSAIQWKLDPRLRPMKPINAYQQEFIVPAAGEYFISLYAELAGCRDTIIKKLIVYENRAQAEANGGLIEIKKNNPAQFVSTLLYPNPITNGRFTVAVELLSEANISVRVIASDGFTELARKEFKATKHNFDFNIPNLAAGLYLVYIEGGGTKKVLRLIVN